MRKKAKGLKTVMCSVCNEQVSRRSTLALSDGSRACRKHEGIEEASRKKLEAEEVKRKDEIKKQQQRSHNPNSAAKETSLVARCMVCGVEGLHQQEYFLLMLKCMEKYRLTHAKVPNIFNIEETLEMFKPMKCRVCLWVIPYTVGLRDRLSKHLDENATLAVGLLGLLMMCPECVKKHKVEIQKPRFKNFGELVTIGTIFDTTLRPFIQGEVLAELKEEAEKN